MTGSVLRPSAAGGKEFIVLMAVLMSVVAISIDAMLPALGVIGEDLQVTHPNQAQYIISFIFSGMAIGQLICGPLSDALGRKTILYGSLLLYLVGSLVCFFADSIGVMLAGRFLQGLGVSGPYVASVSIIRDKFSGRSMARIMSLVMMIFIMVPALAPSLGQAILMVASWHYIYVMYIAYALVVLAWVTLRLEETLAPEHRIPFKFKTIAQSAWTVLRNRTTVVYMLCAGCVFGSLIGYLNSCRQVFQEQYAVGDMFAVYFGGLALSIGAASMVNARLVEKLGMRYISVRATVSILLLTGGLLALHSVMDIELWMFLIYAALLLFCFGLLFGNLNALAMEPMGDLAGIASAIIGSVSSFIAITLGTSIGQMYDGTLVPVLTGFIVLNAASLAFMLFEGRAAKQSLTKSAASL